MVDARPGVTTAGDGVVIRDMRRRHLRGVVSVENSSNPHPWSRRLFETELRQPAARTRVAVNPAGSVVGFGCLLVVGDEAHVTNVAVAPPMRRRGIGGLLLGDLLDAAAAEGVRAATLEVRRGNLAAQRLYAAHGFEIEAVRPRYYSDNAEDALIMWRRERRPGWGTPAP